MCSRPALRAGGAVARGGGEAPHRPRTPVSQLGVSPARQCGRRVPRAVPGARAVLLPQHRDRPDQPWIATGKDPATVGKPYPGVELRTGQPASQRPVPTGDIRRRSGCDPRGSAARSFRRMTVPLARAASRSGAPTARAGCARATSAVWTRRGRLSLIGREDDVVKVDGRRVALGEVAGCLESFGKVREAEARVVIDDLGGQTVIARVVAGAPPARPRSSSTTARATWPLTRSRGKSSSARAL